METYDRAIQLLYKTWQYHFEFLNLAMPPIWISSVPARRQFPDIPDQAIAKMVQGVDVDLFRPDDELKKLAKLAVQARHRNRASDTARLTRRLRRSRNVPNGQQWLGAWKRRRIPGSISRPATASIRPTNTGSNTSTSRSAISGITSSASSEGEDIDRPTAGIAAERDRITRNMPNCSRATPAPPSRASSAWRAPCFPMWRTIISTSSIGRWACSGARCASSAASSMKRDSGNSPMTCSI